MNPRVRRKIDNAAATLLQGRKRRLCCEKGALDVRVHDVLEFLFCQFFQRAFQIDPCRIHENIESRKAFAHRTHEPPRLIGAAQVGGEERGAPIERQFT